jgi:hypothetical protein
VLSAKWRERTKLRAIGRQVAANGGRRSLPAKNSARVPQWGRERPHPGPGDWFNPRSQGVVHALVAGVDVSAQVRAIARDQ